MQTLIQVFCKGNSGSIRKKIQNDENNLDDYYLQVVNKKNYYRADGWLKLKAKGGINGTLNIKWDSKINVLETRVVNRGQGKPDEIIGQFVSYIFGRYSRNIKAIHIVTVD